jgi:tripartite-type tricarboxylate transporter receptor subunit TctC
MMSRVVVSSVDSGHVQAAVADGSLSQPKSDLSDFGQLMSRPNSGKPEFGWERGGLRGYKLSIDPNPLTPTLSPAGRGSPAVPQSNSVLINKVCKKRNQATFTISRLRGFVFVLALLGAPSLVAAYPERPVTIVVPFAPGGANDVVVRAIQQPLAEALGQPIVIENRGGAGGSVGAGYVARARADGYTLLMAATGFVVNPSLYDKVQYDPLADFEQVAEIATFPVIYTVRPDMGVNTLQEFIAYAKARPGVLNYSTPGAGTLPHLAAELLKLNTGVEMVHIPYPGAAPAAQALLSKTVEVASTSITVAKPQIGVGAMKGLAVTGSERWPELPDVPTVGEAGVPAALADTWQGIMVPTGTPKEAVERLATALISVMRRPDVRERLLNAGFYATGRGPAEFHRRIVEEIPKWKTVIQKARITAQ